MGADNRCFGAKQSEFRRQMSNREQARLFENGRHLFHDAQSKKGLMPLHQPQGAKAGT
ncbi:hypothetical protein K4L02_06230 [Phaeobacter inhibens]|uniref:hypothetical protein n=1 Tax=Phaeobacter inhibens TaxID=221822 RepID=UPI0021A2D655|nr:hypothetical protein [Phaeobacter inhibens]UWR65831.1 hypothetical protein K4L02_06230 [Phaeobacter inhibens]